MFLDNLKQTYTESKWYSKVQGFSFDDMITSSNKFFNPDNFNTELPESRKAEYSAWAKVNVTDSGKDYDYVGAFLAGEGRGLSDNGHLTDRWKKPNHPTFSKDSVYATGAYKKYAGTWKQHKDSSWTYIPSRATSKAVNTYIKQNRS